MYQLLVRRFPTNIATNFSIFLVIIQLSLDAAFLSAFVLQSFETSLVFLTLCFVLRTARRQLGFEFGHFDFELFDLFGFSIFHLVEAVYLVFQSFDLFFQYYFAKLFFLLDALVFIFKRKFFGFVGSHAHIESVDGLVKLLNGLVLFFAFFGHPVDFFLQAAGVVAGFFSEQLLLQLIDLLISLFALFGDQRRLSLMALSSRAQLLNDMVFLHKLALEFLNVS